MDVLSLARTTKYLRSTLMSRSSISVWKTSRANISGLPDCPTDLSEPQYANLAFDTSCHVRAFSYHQLTMTVLLIMTQVLFKSAYSDHRME
jgi:hypothetical protein